MGRTIILWFLLLLSLSVPSVSSIRTLKSISDLADNNIEFGKTFPRHGLKLLHWLAHKIQIDQNDVIDLGNMNQYQGHYGFHYFENREGIFPSNVVYYALGNLNPNVHPGSRQLPRDVTNDFYTSDNQHRNEDRIIVQSFSSAPRRVRRVYITLHYSDPYEISPQLLREIQNIPTLEEFLTQAGYDFNSRNIIDQDIFHCRTRRPEFRRSGRSLPECDTSEGLRLEVQAHFTNARITWRDIPKTIMNKNLVLKVYANMDSTDSEDRYIVGQQQSGSIDTSRCLHPGLQVRLMEETGKWLTGYKYIPIWASPEFDEGNMELPTDVYGYDASLQLFVKQGKACVRLYIKRSFTDWKNTFYYSWVGFYKASDEGHSSYVTWQWATKFTENQDRHTDGYLAYEYEFGVDIQDGVQVRFFLEKAVTSVLAQAGPWGEEAIIEIQNNVGDYDASLQLMAIGGEVCARLYIKRTFTDWKDKFYYSWVGIYRSSDDGHRSYYTWQWVTWFNTKVDRFTVEYEAYEYCSDMAVRPGVEARFFLSKDYSKEICRIELAVPDRAVKHSAGLSFLAALLPCILASF